MVLASCLTILAVLLAVGIGIRVMLQNDNRVLANLRTGTHSFYYSIAGIEWSKSEVAETTDFPPIPTNQMKSFAVGSFSVSFSSPAVTGPLMAQIFVRSIGTSANGSHASEVRLTKRYDLSDAAMALRGNLGQIALAGSGIFISGADHDPASGNLLAGAKARPAISTSTDIMRDLVAQTVQDPGLLDQFGETPALAQSDYVSSDFITQLADSLCTAPGAVLHIMPNTENLIIENQLWGSPSSPEIHCVEGLTTSADAVNVTGSLSGAGILIVRNADLALSGAFEWQGLVIITGEGVGLKASGSSGKQILGATLINETAAGTTGSTTLDLQGNFRLLFSRKALAAAAQLMPPATLALSYAALPSIVSQDYWRNALP